MPDRVFILKQRRLWNTNTDWLTGRLDYGEDLGDRGKKQKMVGAGVKHGIKQRLD